MTKKISEWSELIGLENDRYKVESHGQGYCAYLIDKEDSRNDEYLSTGFFYGEINYYDGLLQKCGFDVEIIKHWEDDVK